MSVEDVIQLEIFIVLAQGVVQRLRHSQPAEVKEEFDCHDLDQAGPELCQPGDEGGVGRAGGDEPALPSRDQDLGAPLEGQPPVGVQDVVALLLPYERPLVLVYEAGGHDGLDGGEPLAQPGGDPPQTEDVGHQAVSDNCPSDNSGLVRRY